MPATPPLAHASLLALLALLASFAPLGASVVELPEDVCLSLPAFGAGEEQENLSENLSGAALSGDGGLLVVATDEGSSLLVVANEESGPSFAEPAKLGKKKDEIDLEGVARHGDGAVFYAIGSHSWRRRSILGEKRAGDSYSELKKRFEEKSPDREKHRERLIRVELDPESGELLEATDLDLRCQLEDYPDLWDFRGIPSKENGIDIEGIASDGERLYVGFRGPVYRHGLAVVLVVDADDAGDSELRYVPLDGRGIRDIARVSDGFLIVAGPVGDSPLSYELYHWDGQDRFPGVRESGDPTLGQVKHLGGIPAQADGKAEALVVLEERGAADLDAGKAEWKVLVLYDGPAGGAPTCLDVDRDSP